MSANGQAKCILVVGGTGTGKSEKIKAMLKNAHKDSLLIYDVNAEYTEFYNKPFVEDIEKFVSIAKQVYNSITVFEEATIFFSNKGGSDKHIKSILVRKRHTNNTVIFVFHSLRAIPRDIFDLSDIIILHKTEDIESVVSDKFENDHFTECFLRIKNLPWIDSGKIDTGTGDKIYYSPCEVFHMRAKMKH
jgi:predicted AAA+ superfamily ATPase